MLLDLSAVLLDVDPAIEKFSCMATVAAIEWTSEDASDDGVLAVGIVVETNWDFEESSIVGVAGSGLRATFRLSSLFSTR